MNSPTPRVRELFVAAVKVAPDQWESFLQDACAGDEELRRQVTELLQEHRQAGSFLNEPALPLQAAGAVDSNASEVVADQERAGTLIGTYKLLEQIGEGGMGTVWMAEQTDPVRRKVALKIIKAGMDTRQVVVRFEAERQALAMMDHPNIAKVLDGGATASGRPYFVMELVKGVPLMRYCDEHRLTPRERLELFLPICQAIQHAHQKGIIHRDVKPANILVAPYDGRPVPKVIDFGVAKAIGHRLTERTLFTGFGAVVGTLEYMSPEQAELNNQDIDTRSDIYSLGVLLYELLTGTTPLIRERLKQSAFTEVLRAIREEEPPKPSTRLSASKDTLPSISAQRHMEPAKLTKLVKGELDWIVMRALEKDRNRRYETVHDLAMDVQNYLADAPVQACPPTVGYRLRKFLRRNKVALVTAALIATALVVGALVSTWQAIRATRAEWLADNRLAEQTKALQEAEVQRQTAEGQRKAAEHARKLGVADLLKARAAVDQMLTHVSDERLPSVPQMEPVRKALLEDALKFYQGFLQEHGSDPDLRQGTGEAYRRTGRIYRQLGQAQQAARAYQEGIALLEKLVAEFPAEPTYRATLANTLANAADTSLHLGRLPEAEKAYRRALKLCQELSAEFPANITYLRATARTTRTLGAFLAHMGRQSEAEECFRQALALMEKLGDPAGAGLAEGELAANTGRPREAEQHYRQAIQLLEKQVAAAPDNPTLRYALAQKQREFGLLLRAAGQLPESEKVVRASIAHVGQLVKDFPNTPQYRAGLADAYHHLFGLLVARRQFEEAERTYRQSLPHVEKLVAEAPDQPWHGRLLLFHHRSYAGMLATAGRPGEAEKAYRQAVDVARKLVTQFPDNGKVLSDSADTYRAWGSWLKSAGRLPEAEQAFREALALFEK